MAGKGKLSQTMRIDLIPEVPDKPVQGKKRVVISTPTRRHRRVGVEGSDGISGDASFDELLQSLYDAAVITDMSGQVVNGNARAVEFLKYPREELVTLTIFDIISGADESLVATLAENLENERFTLIQAYCIRNDASYFPAEIAVNKLTIDDVHFCFFLRDVTHTRQYEEMLRTEHNAIQNASNGIAIANLEGLMEYANPAVAAMWKVESAESLKNVDVRDLFADKEAADELLRMVREGNLVRSAETKALAADGIEFDVQFTIGCNRNSEGVPVGFVISFLDISDRKRAEDAERQAERHRVMLESLGAACHHLGQPATVLLANLGIIQKRLDGTDDLVKELVNTSIDAAETLGDILHKLNTVNEYKTTQYLEKPEGSDAEENRILDI